MEGIEQLTVLIVNVSPKELLVDKLEEEIKEWKKDPTDDKFKRMAIACSMIMLKDLIETNGFESVQASLSKERTSENKE